MCRSVWGGWYKASAYTSSADAPAGEAEGHPITPVAGSVLEHRTSAGSGAHLPVGGAAEPGSRASEWPERLSGLFLPLGALPFPVHCEFLSTHLFVHSAPNTIAQQQKIWHPLGFGRI